MLKFNKKKKKIVLIVLHSQYYASGMYARNPSCYSGLWLYAVSALYTVSYKTVARKFWCVSFFYSMVILPSDIFTVTKIIQISYILEIL